MNRSGRAPEDGHAPLNLLIGAARRAARGLGRDLNELEQLRASPESARRYAEAGRERARESLRQSLLEARPAYGWFDERVELPGRDPRRIWAVDPLSGIENFAAGRPGFALSAAMADKGRIEAAVVIDPASGEIFSAGRNTGARRDQFRLRAAGPLAGAGCAVAAPFPDAIADPELRARLFADAANVANLGFGIRGTGSAALDLAWVASGRFHGAWRYGPVSMASRIGAFLVREAGGRAALAKTGAIKTEVTVTASGSAFDMLSEALRGCSPMR